MYRSRYDQLYNIMKINLINLKWIFGSVGSLKNIFLISIILVLPWSIFSVVLKYNSVIFYDPFSLRVFFSNIIFSIFVIIFFKSFVLSVVGFYTFIFLPFISYYFLRKGILFGDLKDLDELMYALGDFSSSIIYLIAIIFIAIAIIVNIRFFNFKNFLSQIILIIFIFLSFIYPKSFEKFFYPTKPNIEDFNVSAAFRFIGPVDALFYNYLDTLSFERDLIINKKLMKYDDFRSFDLNKNNKNIHIILMESFIDPTDFKNIDIDKIDIPKQWIEFKNKNLFYGISPVIGGGSAQAEFEVLCGAPSTLKYGTEFNRIGEGNTNCLPNYLKKFGYKTIASQPMYGSFFNIEKAYKSIGFEESFLTPNFNMSDMNNGWLSDKSFFEQHFELLKQSLTIEKPVLNYLFAVGCHTVLGQSQAYENLIKYPESKILEQFLNCNTESIRHLVEYVNKIQILDPDSLIIILPDHNPPGITSSLYIDAGHTCDRSKYSFCDRRVSGIFIGDHIDIKYKNIAYYELPEIIINYISNNSLCKTINCVIDNDFINLNGSIVDRVNLGKVSDQTLSNYHNELYLSLLRESLLNIE